MPRNLLTPQRIFVALMVLSVLLSQAPASWLQWTTDGPKNLLAAIQSPVEGMLRRIAIKIGGEERTRESSLSAEDYQLVNKELNKLRAQVDALRNELRMLQAIRDYKRLEHVAMVLADVTGWSGDPRQPTLTLNVGSMDGVRVGATAVNSMNLVGRVIDVGPLTSTVQLTTKPRAEYFVRFAAPIHGHALPPALEETQVLRVVYDTQREAFVTVVDDSILVEEGHLAFMHVGNVRSSDDAWSTDADGFVIGKVVSKVASPENPRMQHEILVRPVVDLTRLTRVVVRVVTVEIEPKPGQDNRTSPQ